MRIIKDGRIVEDPWRHLSDDEPAGEGAVSVTLMRWKHERDALLSRAAPLGVRLAAGERPEDLAEDLGHLGLVVLDFSSFRDGRSFSQARILRERFCYMGEIRARGDFIQDQMFFLSRVGVNAFELRDEEALAGALPALSDFSVIYQPAAGDRVRAASAIGRATQPRY